MFWGCTCCEGTHWHLISFNITDPDNPIENWRRAFYNTPDLDSGEDLGEHTDPSKPVWDAAIDNSGNVIAFAETPLDKVAEYGRVLVRRWDASGNLMWSEGMELGNDDTFPFSIANSFVEIAGSFAFTLRQRAASGFTVAKRDLDNGSVVTSQIFHTVSATRLRFGNELLWIALPGAGAGGELATINPATFIFGIDDVSIPHTLGSGIAFVDNSTLCLGGTSANPNGAIHRFTLAGIWMGPNLGGSVTTANIRWLDCDPINRIPYGCCGIPGFVYRTKPVPHPNVPWGGSIWSKTIGGNAAGVITAGTASGNIFVLRSTVVPQILYIQDDSTSLDSLNYRPADQITQNPDWPGTATVIKRSPNSEHMLVCGSTAFDPED